MVTRRAVIAGALLQAVRLRAQTRVERWGIYDVDLDGPRGGNPFVDMRLSATFRNEHRTVEVDGFYDGDGAYKIRFSPDAEGDWSYATRSNRPELNGKTGSFVCVRAAVGNHGRLMLGVSLGSQEDRQCRDGRDQFVHPISSCRNRPRLRRVC